MGTVTDRDALLVGIDPYPTLCPYTDRYSPAATSENLTVGLSNEFLSFKPLYEGWNFDVVSSYELCLPSLRAHTPTNTDEQRSTASSWATLS